MGLNSVVICVLGLIHFFATQAAGQLCTTDTGTRTVRCKSPVLDPTLPTSDPNAPTIAANAIWTELNGNGPANIETLIIGVDSCFNLNQPGCVQTLGRVIVTDTTFTKFTSLRNLYMQYITLVADVNIPADAEFIQPLASSVRLISFRKVTGLSKVGFLAQGTFGMTALEELILDQTEVTTMMPYLARTPALRRMTFTQNCISAIKSTSIPTFATFSLPSLIFLNISNNPNPTAGICSGNPDAAPGTVISIDSAIFKMLPNLEQLSMAGLRQPQQLVTGVTGPPMIPALIGQLSTKLTFWDLSGNMLTSLDGQMQKFTSLTSLNISGNTGLLTGRNISSLSLPKSLRILRAANTGLQWVQGDLLTQLPLLEILDLRNNQLTSFSNMVAEGFMRFGRSPATNQLLLQGNPLECGCGIFDLIHWLSSSLGHQPSGQPILCNIRDPYGAMQTVQQCPTCSLNTDGATTTQDLNATVLLDRFTSVCPAIYAHSENRGNGLVSAGFVSLLLTAFLMRFNL